MKSFYYYYYYYYYHHCKKIRLYLIQLLWQFSQIFVYGDVVCAQTWEVLTLKNPIEPPKVHQFS